MTVSDRLPPRAPGTLVRLLATNDLLGAVTPLPATYGQGGSVHGVAALLERAAAEGPALWVDAGDLSLGGAAAPFGHAVLPDLAARPLAAAAAGNHDFDAGAGAPAAQRARLGLPLLCADRDAGLPAGALLETPAGPVGVVGIGHPEAHELAPAPAAPADATERILAAVDGARWVIALLHDGATWWPHGDGIATRTDRLAAVTRPWASAFDAVLGGHTLGAWTGALHGVPAGHAHPFAASALVVDLPAPPSTATVHPPVRVPPVAPPVATPATDALAAAAAQAVGHVSATWATRPGTDHYLPDLVAATLLTATGADAAFVPPSSLFTQAPLDGTVAALRAGPVTELDLLRLAPFEGDDVAVAALGAGDFTRLVAGHDAAISPANAATDHCWWNWARLRAGTAVRRPDDAPASVALPAFAAPIAASWLGRDLAARPADVAIRTALRASLG
jgi:2',3'-cyclic-nucleotide 2'-phosphodiesterase (5'-nucleotidase family)